MGKRDTCPDVDGLRVTEITTQILGVATLLSIAVDHGTALAMQQLGYPVINLQYFFDHSGNQSRFSRWTVNRKELVHRQTSRLLHGQGR